MFKIKKLFKFYLHFLVRENMSTDNSIPILYPLFLSYKIGEHDCFLQLENRSKVQN